MLEQQLRDVVQRTILFTFDRPLNLGIGDILIETFPQVHFCIVFEVFEDWFVLEEHLFFVITTPYDIDYVKIEYSGFYGDLV